MSLSPSMRALPSTVLLLIALWLPFPGPVQADGSRVVLWLAGSESGGREREQALRLELEARGIMLLTAEASAPDKQAPAPAAPPSREALARSTLARSQAAAVLWLEGDPERPVSWLRVIHRGKEAPDQAPLPHPPAAIKPELFALAAASLLEQVLRPGAVAPAEPKPNLQVAPATVAPPAAAAAPTQARPAAPARRVAADRSTAHASPPADRNWFVQVGFSYSLAYLTSGMEAATRPPRDEIFITQSMPDEDPDPDDDIPPPMVDRYYFDDRSAWVPDGDSFDDYEDPERGVPRGRTPVPGDCSADGTVTGPPGATDVDGERFTQLEPSSYCVRVEMPGFSIVPALRLAFGRWLLPRFALAILYQGHFGIDADSFFGNQLFGLLAEYFALGVRGRGVTLSLLGGLTVGRTETPVVPKDPDRASVNALSGPMGLQGGALLRVWPIADFALFASPALGLRFPAGQFTADLSAGAEVPF